MRAITIPPTNAVALAVVPLFAAQLLNGFWKEPLYHTGLTPFWAVDVAQNVLLPMICVSFLVLSANLWPRSYGFGSLPTHWSTGDKLTCFIGSTFALLFIYWLATNIAWAFLWRYEPTFNIGDPVPVQQPGRGVILLYMALTAGFVEEAVYRSQPCYYMRDPIFWISP